MFCPKCGTKNPEDGKFCRSCGADIDNVRKALEGSLVPRSTEVFPMMQMGLRNRRSIRRLDPNEVYGDAVRHIVSGFGFFVISMVLLLTGVAGGRSWWWALLFPAFTFLAGGVSDLMRSRKMESKPDFSQAAKNTELGVSAETMALPNVQPDFIPPKHSFDTGELVLPPSATEHTTNRLEIDQHGETKNFQKKD